MIAARLARLAALDSEALTAEDAEWICAGARAVLAGEAESLDCALGLRPQPGQRCISTIAASDTRDRLLRVAARQFFTGLPASTQAERLAEALSRYRGGADWRRDRTAAEIHYRANLRGHCWAILRAVDHPLSARRIRAILATS